MPIIKPKNPIHAERLWSKGLSSTLLKPWPILSRNEMRVNVMKNSMENDKATAMKAAAEAAGAYNTSCGALPGRADRSSMKEELSM
jgi:hypothetical protein